MGGKGVMEVDLIGLLIMNELFYLRFGGGQGGCRGWE